MRISGVRVPAGYPRWLALGLGQFLLAAGVTFTADTLGLTGFTGAERTGTPVTATVSAGTPCGTAGGAGERVRFTLDGQEREVRFDGCGHQEGEEVEISVPPDAQPDLVVYAARAATGDAVRGEGLASLLLLSASAAGAGYAYLLRRTPRIPRS